MPDSESSLLVRCRVGEPGAWDALFDQHYDAVGRFVFQFSPDLSHEDIEDICQEVFLAAVRNLASFRGGSAIQTWLFRIAVNKTRDFLEKRGAAKRGGGRPLVSLDQPDPQTGLTPDPPGDAAGPDEALASHEQGVALRAALDALGDPCRTVIELRYFGDLSYDEIARELGLSIKAAGSRLHKCLRRLADLLKTSPAGKAPPLKTV
jgi:RNA polymerase sigma-70 factor (ECF subfamily)